MTGSKQPCCENDPDQPITRAGRRRRQLIIGGAATRSTIIVFWEPPPLPAPECFHFGVQSYANWYGSAYNAIYGNAAAIKSVVNAILSQEYENANSQAQQFVTAAQVANKNSC